MVKFLKPGKVVIVLRGKYAGKKAVITRVSEEPTNATNFGHAYIAGIAEYPLPISRTMSRKTIAKRSRVKPFLKKINLNHVMPTRYNFEMDYKTISIKKKNNKLAKKAIRKVFENRYQSGKNKWFFTKLRF